MSQNLLQQWEEEHNKKVLEGCRTLEQAYIRGWNNAIDNCKPFMKKKFQQFYKK